MIFSFLAAIILIVFIQVNLKQNYKSEWESASFKAVYIYNKGEDYANKSKKSEHE